jgi:hypothetical protein
MNALRIVPLVLLVATGSLSNAQTVASADSAWSVNAPSVRSARPPSQIRLGGASARERPIAPSIQHATAALSDAYRAVHATAFAISRSDIEAIFADPMRARVFAHDVLFWANSDTRDPKKWAPSYRTWNTEFEVMTLSPVSGAALRALLNKSILHSKRSDAFNRGVAEKTLDQLFGSILRGPFLLYWAHWDNRDDTTFEGAIAVSKRTGEVRVLMTNNFA